MWLLFFFILLIISLFLEGFFVQLPLVLLVILLATIVTKKEWLFFVAIIAGIILDSMTLRVFGISSIFFVCVQALVFAYNKKFEVQTIPFVVGASLLSGGMYAFVFGYGSFLLQLLGVTIVSGVAFLCWLFAMRNSPKMAF